MMYSKYSNIITAVKMILETNLNELRLTRGGKLLNAEFIASMEKTLGEWTMATSTIEEATTIEGLEQSFNLYTEMTGDSIGADVIDEIDKLVDEAINAATTKEEIRQLGDVFKKVVEQNCICTIGNSQKIAENKEMFKEIKEIC